MSGANIFLLFLILALFGVLQIASHRNVQWTFLSGSLLSIALFAAHVVLGIVILMVFAQAGLNGSVGGLIAAYLGWLGLGMLDLIRTIPRMQEPPAFLMTRGWADIICLIVIAAGLAIAWG